MIITQAILQRHGGTLNCKGCGQPIEEGKDADTRRVNSRIRYFHQSCIYTEAKPTEEAEG